MELTILSDILIIFALSTFVNFIFTKLKIPTIIGYLFTGIIAGPHLFALIKSQDNIEIMAEIGIVLLLFTIGMEFSLKHLIKIRKIVFFGGLMQLVATAIIVMLVARGFELNWSGAIYVGFLTALSSTAVVLKLLQERSEITSNYGRTILGILIFQDIIIIPLLLLTPILAGNLDNITGQFIILFIKAVVIIVVIFAGAKWVMPKLLHAIAMTKNQELFLMSIFLICLGVALFTHELGMSLAFGAFLAGLMVSESRYIPNTFSSLNPFKDTFTSFFFVSIGMLLDLQFVVDHYIVVIATVLVVIILKFIIASFTALALGHTFRGIVMVGVALSQVGEFSFILAKEGMGYNIISDYYYQLFLAVAVISMSVSPFTINKSRQLANLLLKLPISKSLQNGLFPLKQIEIPALHNHLVLIGKDSRSLRLSQMAKHMKLPYISIIFDPAIVEEKQKNQENVIYGDAMNDPILRKSQIENAEVVVVSIGDLMIAMGVIEKVRMMNKHAYILVRTKHVDDIEELYQSGADKVIPEEFETAIELFDRVLIKYLMPQVEIQKYIAKIREDNYGIFRKEEQPAEKFSILSEIPNIEIVALKVEEGSYIANKSLEDIHLRKTYGITAVAVKKKDQIIENPTASLIINIADIVYVLGKPEAIANAMDLFIVGRDIKIKE
jgi:monovalent cation:H+ antiporter-2, CPA2 family